MNKKTIMNKDIIEKLIKLNNETCPEFSYTNPLLDKNVTRAVSKSIVKTLYKSNQIGRKQNVRASMLQTIRNMCKTAPEGHVEIDEDLTEVLTSFYEKQLTKTATKSIDRQLDAFLIRKSKFTNINTRFESNVNPEVVQALLNLKENIVFSEEINREIVHWNLKDQKAEKVLQKLWSEDINHGTTFYENISIKMKSKLENVLLIQLHRLLETQNSGTETLFTDIELASLVKSCALSAECFQICTTILNSIFITTNFNNLVQKFIFSFVQNVKLKSKTPLSVLYPVNLSNIVTILDVNLDDLPHSLKKRYVKLGKDNLKTLHNKSENGLIMLLSHFPVWFNIYFDTYNVFCCYLSTIIICLYSSQPGQKRSKHRPKNYFILWAQIHLHPVFIFKFVLYQPNKYFPSICYLITTLLFVNCPFNFLHNLTYSSFHWMT